MAQRKYTSTNPRKRFQKDTESVFQKDVEYIRVHYRNNTPNARGTREVRIEVPFKISKDENYHNRPEEVIRAVIEAAGGSLD